MAAPVSVGPHPPEVAQNGGGTEWSGGVGKTPPFHMPSQPIGRCATPLA